MIAPIAPLTVTEKAMLFVAGCLIVAAIIFVGSQA